ncbi:LssY C-terminal domain-containing protein [Sphingomonas oryzagri]
MIRISPQDKREHRRLKPWHWYSITALLLLAVPLLWFVMAYGELPHLWSKHEHRKIGARGQIQTYTAQDIPGDPISLHLHGSREAIACAFRRAGWALADPVNLPSAIRIGTSVVLGRPYPQAPVSPLYLRDEKQEMAFEEEEGKSADQRHHVRFWQVGNDDWLGAASFDRGVGVSLFTLQVTHHIAPDVDADRDTAGRLLVVSGAKRTGTESNRIAPNQWHRNGGGDRYRTDGRIDVYMLPAGGC